MEEPIHFALPRAAEWAPPIAKELPTCRLRIISRGKSTIILLEVDHRFNVYAFSLQQVSFDRQDGTTGSLFSETPVKEPLDKCD